MAWRKRANAYIEAEKKRRLKGLDVAICRNGIMRGVSASGAAAASGISTRSAHAGMARERNRREYCDSGRADRRVKRR